MSRQKLGQHFLTDPAIAKKIVDSFPPLKGDIIEIGPGKGFLTGEIISRNLGIRYIGVEIDSELAAALRERYDSKVELIIGDIRGTELRPLRKKNDFILIGNIPYYISRPVVSWIISNSDLISGGTLLVQSEFYEKLISGPGSSSYNPAGIVFNMIYESKKNFDIKAGSFSPPPKVRSTLFSYIKKDHLISESDAKKFYTFLKKLFRMRRKKILNNIEIQYRSGELKSRILKSGLDLNERAENISSDKLYKLFKLLA